MRNISLASLDKLAQKTGTEPIIILKISWTDTTAIAYADKKLDGVDGLILQFSDLTETLKIGDIGTAGSLSVTLDDTDGIIKGIMDRFDINKRPVAVYQYFDGMLLSEAFVLFNGIIVSPIVWSEGDRTISFNIINHYNSAEVGFSPESGAFPSVYNELLGKPWPLCFGSPIHVPATKVSTVATGTLMAPYCIPDSTLPYKQILLNRRLDKLETAYNTCIEMIEDLKEIARPARVVEEEYAEKIIGHDNLKQIIEDIATSIEKQNIQIDQRTRDFFDAENHDDADEIKSDLETMKGVRDKWIKYLQNLYLQMKNVEKDLKYMEQEGDLCKYRITAVNKLMVKARELTKTYIAVSETINEIIYRLGEQLQLQGGDLGVVYGTDFPQGGDLELDINGSVVRGQFNGNRFRVATQRPNYTQVPIGQKIDDEPNTLYINNDDFKYSLSGKYLYVKVQGYDRPKIVRVTQQQGNKLTLELPKIAENKVFKDFEIDYKDDPHDKQAVEQGLKHILTGIETPDEINEIANRLPKDISPTVSNRLFGGTGTQYIEITKFANNALVNSISGIDPLSWYTLVYGDDEETEKIYVTDSPGVIKDKILASTVSLDDNDFNIVNATQTNGDYRLKLTTNLLMKSFRVNRSMLRGSGKQYRVAIEGEIRTEPASIVLQYNRKAIKSATTHSLEGTFSLIVNGQTFTFDADDTTPADISDKINDPDIILEDPDFECASVLKNPDGSYSEVDDAPLLEADIVIRFNHKFSAILFDTTNVDITLSDDYLYATPYDASNRPCFSCFYYGGSAFENTRSSRDKKLDDLVDRNIQGAAIKDGKTAIRKILKKMEEAAQDKDERKELQFVLQDSLQNMTNISLKINQENFSNDEVFKVISDREYKFLYEMEITAYLEWLNNYRDLDVKLKDQEYNYTGSDIVEIMEASTEVIDGWLRYLDSIDDENELLEEIDYLPDKTIGFYGFVGDTATLVGDYQEVYVANIIPSQVLGVYAKRTVSGFTRLVPVPVNYYQINGAQPFGSLICTVVSLRQPLKNYNEGWQDGIYVTLQSSVGPNVADIIGWIVTHFSDLTLDASSFAAVGAALVNYPANFALLTKQELIPLIEDIAYQSRCSIRIVNNVVFIRYLSAEPTSVRTITEDDVEQGSLKLTFTETEELYTRFIAQWRPNHYQDKPWEIIVRNNMRAYATNTITKDYYIYNIQQLVYKSLTFWTLMKAKAWKLAQFKLFLNNLDLEIDDCITLDFKKPYFSNGPVKALITKASYNSDSKSIDMECWVPIVSGSLDRYALAWPAYLSVGTLFPLNIDISGNNAGSPNGISVTTGAGGGGIDLGLNRPKDFGDPKINDIDDALPQNPASEIRELDYIPTDFPEGLAIPKDQDGLSKMYNSLKFELSYDDHKIRLPNKACTFIGLGRLYKNGGVEDTEPDEYDGTADNVPIQRIAWTVLLSGGQQVKAYQDGFGNDPGLPTNYPVFVVYDHNKEEYLFVPPVFLPGEIPD